MPVVSCQEKISTSLEYWCDTRHTAWHAVTEQRSVLHMRQEHTIQIVREFEAVTAAGAPRELASTMVPGHHSVGIPAQRAPKKNGIAYTPNGNHGTIGRSGRFPVAI